MQLFGNLKGGSLFLILGLIFSGSSLPPQISDELLPFYSTQRLFFAQSISNQTLLYFVHPFFPGSFPFPSSLYFPFQNFLW
uniref:Putative secreted protein n=1 Tax=Panstrongylus lignarius TaxID=156445 RepID=A0A224XWH7_9HEMI